MGIILYILMQVAVLVVVGIVGSIIMAVLGIRISPQAYGGLFVMCAIFGCVGSIISLFLSKSMCIRAYGVQIIERPQNRAEEFLVREIASMAQRAGIGMPQVGIYYSADPNAFATGASKNNALVAVSSGLLNNMNDDEIRGVLGHEITHIANGDMVTMSLLQGVLNTFVYFFSYIAAQAVSGFGRSDDEEGNGGGNIFIFYMVQSLFQALFGVLATMIAMWFSRWREYRADAGSAHLEGSYRMISALQALQRLSSIETQKEGQFSAFCINGGKVGLSELFMSHPPLEKRIAALRAAMQQQR